MLGATFDLYVARLFGRYLFGWLEDAGLEYGVQRPLDVRRRGFAGTYRTGQHGGRRLTLRRCPDRSAKGISLSGRSWQDAVLSGDLDSHVRAEARH